MRGNLDIYQASDPEGEECTQLAKFVKLSIQLKSGHACELVPRVRPMRLMSAVTQPQSEVFDILQRI